MQVYRTVRYIYTTNLDDFKAAQHMLKKQCPRFRKSFLFWHRFMPWIGAAALILLLRDMLFEHFSYPAGAAALLGTCAGLGIIPILSHPAHVRKLYHAMKNGRLDDEPLELEIVEDARLTYSRSKRRPIPASKY